ncbi:hypothetical protein [Flexivirga caeni]|uniref:Uncharacterized protein n=1 Tax=Flexivirga caeni TaxID=2294115 RepID=A0A3M9MFQ2_9MICO|nr:hypothetical protein [Flexivirga caeni]RNI24371.1 hypothetical protein EFY87_05270 [Flexivirga caeni]
MTDGWNWTYEDAQGVPATAAQAVTSAFPTQSDAESWLGEHWRSLFDAGVTAVTLRHAGRTVYGPMLLSVGG